VVPAAPLAYADARTNRAARRLVGGLPPMSVPFRCRFSRLDGRRQVFVTGAMNLAPLRRAFSVTRAVQPTASHPVDAADLSGPLGMGLVSLITLSECSCRQAHPPRRDARAFLERFNFWRFREPALHQPHSLARPGSLLALLLAREVAVARKPSSQSLGGSFDISSGQTVSTTALISSVTLSRTGVSTT
jgi:hypothetical protein